MGSSMTALLIIAVTALFTFLTRAVPFLFFGGKKTSPPWILFLGRVLPPAIIAILVIYCLRNIPRQRLPLVSPKLLRF